MFFCYFQLSSHTRQYLCRLLFPGAKTHVQVVGWFGLSVCTAVSEKVRFCTIYCKNIVNNTYIFVLLFVEEKSIWECALCELLMHWTGLEFWTWSNSWRFGDNMTCFGQKLMYKWCWGESLFKCLNVFNFCFRMCFYLFFYWKRNRVSIILWTLNL